MFKPYLYILPLLILFITACDSDRLEGPNNKSTENTVSTFPIFTETAPWSQKVIDKDGNLYFYAGVADNYKIGTEHTYDVGAHSFVKLGPNLEQLDVINGAKPFVDRKITISPDNVFYVRSGTNTNPKVRKISLDGNLIGDLPLQPLTRGDVAADGAGNYFTMELETSNSEIRVHKYSESGSEVWSQKTGAIYSQLDRLSYMESGDLILLMTKEKLFAYNNSDGTLAWELTTPPLECAKNNNNNRENCTAGFIETTSNNEIFYAYTSSTLKNSDFETFVTIVKLDATGNQLFSKTILSDKPDHEDVFITGLTSFNGNYYLAVNLAPNRVSFSALEAYIGKYSGSTGEEIWRQYPSWEYKRLDDFPAKDFNLAYNPVHIRDLNQDPVTGKLWTTIAIDLSDNIAHPDGINAGVRGDGNITRITAESYFGSISHEEEYRPSVTIHRNLSSLEP
jgi:hypothetical protein